MSMKSRFAAVKFGNMNSDKGSPDERTQYDKMIGMTSRGPMQTIVEENRKLKVLVLKEVLGRKELVPSAHLHTLFSIFSIHMR